MATELTESNLITKIADIDTEIATITDALGSSGTNGAQFTQYSIGSKSVNGSQRLEQLLKVRETYQKLLQQIPSIFHRHHDYPRDGHPSKDDYEEIGDQ